MGIRKYFYILFFVFFLMSYLPYRSRNTKIDYTFPMGDNQPIAIVLFGDKYPDWAIDYTKRVVEKTFGTTIEIVRRPETDLNAAYASGRKQYRVEVLLDQAYTYLPDRFYRGLLLVNVNLFHEGTNFVYGTADNPGRMAAVTLKGYGNKIGGFLVERTMMKRILRVLIIHELGHTFGLYHCQEKCVMEYGDNERDERKKHDRYCQTCEDKLLAL